MVPHTLRRDFGKRIAQLRREHGWTQSFVAEKAGISSEYLSRVENGHKEPCLDLMAELGKAFNLNLSQILKDIDAPK